MHAGAINKYGTLLLLVCFISSFMEGLIEIITKDGISLLKEPVANGNCLSLLFVSLTGQNYFKRDISMSTRSLFWKSQDQ